MSRKVLQAGTCVALQVFEEVPPSNCFCFGKFKGNSTRKKQRNDKQKHANVSPATHFVERVVCLVAVAAAATAPPPLACDCYVCTAPSRGRRDSPPYHGRPAAAPFCRQRHHAPAVLLHRRRLVLGCSALPCFVSPGSWSVGVAAETRRRREAAVLGVWERMFR